MNNRQFAILVSITFFVGMVWLVADIIFNTKPSIPVSDKLQTTLEPIDPNLNSKIIEIIDKEVMDKNKMIIPAQKATTTSPLPQASTVSARINL